MMLTLRQRSTTAICCGIVAALAGCTGSDWSEIGIGTTSREMALRTLGEGTVETSDGLTLEEVRDWPTAMQVTHIEAPAGQAVQWKLSYRGAVTHWLVNQVVETDVLYEGPLPGDVMRALRLPETMGDNEFIGSVVQFVQGRISATAPARWSDLEQVRSDKYRSRFLGLMNVTMSSLSGQGRLKREDFRASVTGASPGSLELEYLGSGIYRVKISGSSVLGPFPVL